MSNKELCEVCDREVDADEEAFACEECMCPHYVFNVDHTAPLDFNVDDSKSTYIPDEHEQYD